MTWVNEKVALITYVEVAESCLLFTHCAWSEEEQGTKLVRPNIETIQDERAGFANGGYTSRKVELEFPRDGIESEECK